MRSGGQIWDRKYHFAFKKTVSWNELLFLDFWPLFINTQKYKILEIFFCTHVQHDNLFSFGQKMVNFFFFNDRLFFAPSHGCKNMKKKDCKVDNILQHFYVYCRSMGGLWSNYGQTK
jgi:hypothetical protein